jgi:hypothetical protein
MKKSLLSWLTMLIAAITGIFFQETLWLTSIIFLISFVFLFRPSVIKQTSEGWPKRAVVLGFIFFSLIIAGFVSVVISSQVPEYFEKIGILENEMAPWVEEGAKLLCTGIVILGLVNWGRKNMFQILFFGGLTVGLTFGFLETITSERYLANFFLRLRTSIPDHALWTAVTTAVLWFPIRKYQKYKLLSLVPVLVVYFITSTWHSVWNTGAFFEILQWVPVPTLTFLIALTAIKSSHAG